MKPRNHKSFFEEVAKEIGVHKDVVDDFVTFYYSRLRKNLSELKDTHINIANLGTFILRKSKLEKAIKISYDFLVSIPKIL